MKTFIGGIHPDDGKRFAKDKQTVRLLPQEELVYPVSQHAGAPAKPIVKKGDRVLKGQVIAEPGGSVSIPIHATVSGTVKIIETRVDSDGKKVESIVVTNDNLYEEVEYPERKPLSELTTEEILQYISEAGVVGMGGAGFPTAAKLAQGDAKDIQEVIANCAECEPFKTSDYRRMLENPEELIEGMRVMMKLFPNAKGIFAIEDNKMDCIEKISKMIENEERMSVRKLYTKYPQGSSRQLIYAVTQKAGHAGIRSAKLGVVVDNVETLIAIYHAVVHGKPSLERVVTVTGDGIPAPGNYMVPFGMSFRQIFEASQGNEEEIEKIVSGGPMMGKAMFTVDAPITKTSSALICFKVDHAAKLVETPCIKCGRCVEVCPSRLVPSKLAEAGRRGQEDLFVQLNGQECMECGSCSYVCPAKRQLVQSIGTMRKIVNANRKKQKK